MRNVRSLKRTVLLMSHPPSSTFPYRKTKSNICNCRQDHPWELTVLCHWSLGTGRTWKATTERVQFTWSYATDRRRSTEILIGYRTLLSIIQTQLQQCRRTVSKCIARWDHPCPNNKGQAWGNGVILGTYSHSLIMRICSLLSMK